jgi:hypothetical protein
MKGKPFDYTDYKQDYTDFENDTASGFFNEILIV